MSSSRPVSFQYPETTWERTSRPDAMSQPIASVISSSPRPDGLIARTASCTDGPNM